MMGWLMLIGSIIFNVAGKLLVKAFSTRANGHSLLEYRSIPFICGIAAFGFGVFFYGRALQQIPIVLAYPIQVGTCAFVIVLVAISAFGERLGLQSILGILSVLSGIEMLSRVA